MLRNLIVLATAAVALSCPAAAAADDVVFGSPLTDPANTVPFQHGWDQNVFNIGGPGGIAAPQPGLIKQVKLRGFAADGKGPLEIKFRVIRPVGTNRWQAVSTPLVAQLPPTDGVHVYDVPDPRTFRVQAGDLIGVFQQGFGGAGRRWQIFSANSAWTIEKVATDKNAAGVENGFNDGDLSPANPVNREGNSTVTYPNTELLLQAVESPDLCPGTDLPQEPCQSRLYLGGKVNKSRRAIRYTWTVRNGGPHDAANLVLQVNLPRGTVVPGLPQGCGTVPGPPFAVVCNVGSVAAPQNGDAVTRISFVVVPKKVTRHFRAVGQIEAPNVDDPQGGAHHLKTVSTSTRFLASRR
jgi:hypothetical protein